MEEKKQPRIKILVACHKADPNILQDDIYMPIQVGKALHPELDLGFQCDNTGDNISEKNGSYCELTALYWAWKNMIKDFDYIGLCHYRRYFNFESSSHVEKQINDTENILSTNLEIKSNLIDEDTVILPTYVNLPYSVKNHFQSNVLSQDIYILYKVIHKYYPGYLNAFEKYMLGNKRTGYNMFVMHANQFEKYMTFLFGVLKIVEKSVRLCDYISYKRVFGYLGEILLPVYCMTNNLKIRKRQIYFVNNSEVKHRWYIFSHLRNFLNNISFSLSSNWLRKKNYKDNYWELYLKLDGIEI